MNKNTMWIVVVIALLIGAYIGYAYEKPKLTASMMMSADLQNQLNTAKGENAKLMKSNAQVSVTPSTAPTQ
jgi:uncharacterized membrane-anchored protein YhcB (DUF1043 family)